ncbi:MAG: hypothetical protein KDJ35_08500 [Alphaproteobacteria bacterium]|nr:hypothetical protein [Alphaproteobacteria bacterium]
MANGKDTLVAGAQATGLMGIFVLVSGGLAGIPLIAFGHYAQKNLEGSAGGATGATPS